MLRHLSGLIGFDMRQSGLKNDGTHYCLKCIIVPQTDLQFESNTSFAAMSSV